MHPFELLLCAGVFCITSTAGSPNQEHPLPKRQTDSGGRCSQVAMREGCTGGVFEEYASLLLQCNSRSGAAAIHESCISNSMGFFCGSQSDDLFIDTNNACGAGALPGTCTPECRDFLIATRARLGCCVSLFNDSSSTLYEPEPFRYSLWSLCGVETVTEQCAPSPFALPQAQVDPTCNQTVFQERLIADIFCRRDFIEALRDELSSEDCEDSMIIEGATQQCVVNEAGQFCSSQPGTSSLIQAAFDNCEGTTSECDPSCTAALTNAVNTAGCCFISEYNTTSANPRDWLSFEYWQRCDLTSPGFCEIRFSNAAILKAPGKVIGFTVVLLMMVISFI